MDVTLLDSITDAGPDASGRVVASGSHGGLYPAAVASLAGVRAVAFNDAGIGYQEAGIAGVMALDAVGMAAIAAGCMSCRIGDAADLARNGTVSAANGVARGLGIARGMPVAEALARMADAPAPRGTLPKIAEARRTHRIPGGPEVELLDSALTHNSAHSGAGMYCDWYGQVVASNVQRAGQLASQTFQSACPIEQELESIGAQLQGKTQLDNGLLEMTAPE